MLVSLVALDSIAGLTAAMGPVCIDLFFYTKLGYTPLRLFQGGMFYPDRLIKIGSWLCNILQAALLVFGIGAVLFFVFCRLCWRQWAVAGK